ncbi:7109_t:CDS:2, partial [Racocetra fulgida]
PSNESTTTSHPSTPLPTNHQRYKDLLIFEERLKQNLHQLQRRSYKYEVFYKKVPKKFQEGFERYRQMYYTKKNQRAKEREEKEKMGK